MWEKGCIPATGNRGRQTEAENTQNAAAIIRQGGKAGGRRGCGGGTTIPTTTLQHEERTKSSVGSHSSRKKSWEYWETLFVTRVERRRSPFSQIGILSIVHLEFSYINVWFDASDTACCVSRFNIPDFSLLSSFLPSDSSFILMTCKCRPSWTSDSPSVSGLFLPSPLQRNRLMKPFEFKMERRNSMLFHICVKLWAWSLNSYASTFTTDRFNDIFTFSAWIKLILIFDFHICRRLEWWKNKLFFF